MTPVGVISMVNRDWRDVRLAFPLWLLMWGVYQAASVACNLYTSQFSVHQLLLLTPLVATLSKKVSVVEEATLFWLKIFGASFQGRTSAND